MPQKSAYFAFVAVSVMLGCLTPAVFGAAIDVNINEIIQSEAKQVNHTMHNGVLKIAYEVFNSGSSEYGARMRLDIFNGTKYLKSIWSPQAKMNPVDRELVEIYWFEPKEASNLSANLRIYRGYEIADLGNLTEDFTIIDTFEDLSIERVRIYDNEIRFKIKSVENAKKVIIYPKEHPRSWLFEQTSVDNIDAGKSKSGSIHYETGLFAKRKVTLFAFTEDGAHYGTKTFFMKKETGLSKWVNRLRDWLNI